MINFVSFPAVSHSTEDGLLAMGGDLSVDTLVSAYSQGIFPWFNDDQPILWWSPDPRLVLYPRNVKLSRSLRKVIRRNEFTVSCNTQFKKVIKGCALRGSNKGLMPNAGTWITTSMHEAYTKLHELGYAHSIEVWHESILVGGLYGVALGNVFFGESMFSTRNDASKVALVALCRWLDSKGYSMIDCQVSSDHLLSMGAQDIPREEFLGYLYNIDYTQAKPDFSNGFSKLTLENVINKL